VSSGRGMGPRCFFAMADLSDDRGNLAATKIAVFRTRPIHQSGCPPSSARCSILNLSHQCQCRDHCRCHPHGCDQTVCCHHRTAPTAERLRQYRDVRRHHAGAADHRCDTAVSRQDQKHGEGTYHRRIRVSEDLLRCDGSAHDTILLWLVDLR
jgi:hypothetical protein